MMDTYNPTAASKADVLAAVARVGRYVKRHGSPYGETPVPGGDMEEAAAVIVADWQTADWSALELTYWERNGALLFPPTLTDTGRHLRAVLFMAGRARKRGWVEAGPMRRNARAESRRRDMDDSSGAGMASRAPDPARVAAAVEDAKRAGLFSTPDRFKRWRLRWVKSRNSTRTWVTITRPAPAVISEDGRVTYREGASTGIRVERVTVYNFRRAGDMPARGMPKTRKRVPEGVTADTLREAITG